MSQQGTATVVGQTVNGTVVGQQNTASLGGNVSGSISFSQGDTIVINLTATDGYGNPFNLTGATFQTQILGPNGQAIATFANSKHSIVSASLGTYTLTLSSTDTASCGLGSNKEIVTQVTQGSNVIYFHGPNLLQVLPAFPLQ